MQVARQPDYQQNRNQQMMSNGNNELKGKEEVFYDRSNSYKKDEKEPVLFECDRSIVANKQEITASSQLITSYRKSEPLIFDSSNEIIQKYSSRRFHSYRNLQFEVVRFATFKEWKVDFIDPRDLSRNGFFYLHKGDLVQCIYCRGVVGYWEKGDKPAEEHEKHFPNCPLVQGSVITNVLLTEKDLNDYLVQKLDNETPPRHKAALSSDSVVVTPDSPAADHYPEFSLREKRLRTYIDAPANIPNAEKMTDAGFFWLGLSDMAQCYSCGGGVFNWKKSEDPLEVHARLYPKCRLNSNKAAANQECENERKCIDISILEKMPLTERLSKISWSKEMISKAFAHHLQKYGTLPITVAEAIDVVDDYEEMLEEQQA